MKACWNRRLYWLILLVLSQLLPALTPDTASLTSSRLLRMIESCPIEHEAPTARPEPVQAGTIADSGDIPYSSPAPIEPRPDDQEPLEGCLVFGHASDLLRGVLRDRHSAEACVSVPATQPSPSSTTALPAGPCSTPTDPARSLRTLCRMTC